MKINIIIAVVLIGVLSACGTTKSTDKTETSLKESLNDKNRIGISLLNQIRKLPGVALRNGVPVFTKNTAAIAEGVPFEPLYILDDYIVGNSFRDVDQLVDNVNVDKIETFTDSDASFYGSRAANGVIKITTLK